VKTKAQKTLSKKQNSFSFAKFEVLTAVLPKFQIVCDVILSVGNHLPMFRKISLLPSSGSDGIRRAETSELLLQSHVVTLHNITVLGEVNETVR